MTDLYQLLLGEIWPMLLNVIFVIFGLILLRLFLEFFDVDDIAGAMRTLWRWIKKLGFKILYEEVEGK
jgi:hypothetical protein